jgi:hypothetical protein
MSRRRTPEHYVQQKVSFPATLFARFSQYHWDPVLNKLKYGAISKVMTDLLTDYVNKLENPPTYHKPEKDQ